MDWRGWVLLVSLCALGCGPIVGGDPEPGSSSDPSTSTTDDPPVLTTVEPVTTDEPTTDEPMVFDLPSPTANVSGPYLFALSPSIDPNAPLQWIANVAHDTSTGALVIEIQSLSLDQGSTTFPREPVGNATILQAGLGADGRIGIETPEILVPGAANPITGSDLTASLVIQGQVFGRELWCGEIFGEVTSPLNLDLAGSTFAFEPIEGPSLPDPVLARCPD